MLADLGGGGVILLGEGQYPIKCHARKHYYYWENFDLQVDI